MVAPAVDWELDGDVTVDSISAPVMQDLPVRLHLVSSVAAAAVLAAACTGGEPEPAATPSSEPSDIASTQAAVDPTPAPSITAIDISVVPPVEQMTVEYVEAVVNAIEAESGKLFAGVLAEPVNPLGATPAGTIEGLQQLFGSDRLELKIREAEALAASEEARAVVLPASQYIGVRYEILQVSYAEPGCMIAVGRINRDGTSREGGPDPALSILSLTPLNVGSGGINPTIWQVLDSTPNQSSDGTLNEDSFAFSATMDILDGVVPHTCVDGESSRVG